MLQHKKLGKRNEIGGHGEEIAKQFLVQRKFICIAQNYLEKWGEIDLIMQKNGVIHFIEVKTVSYPTVSALQASYTSDYRPEEQLTRQKYRKLSNTIATWIAKETYPGEYQLDLITVRLSLDSKYAEVQYFPSITLD